MDRRVRRTRERLHQALMALLVERGYENTTVQDIIDRADAGRSTFYAHFTGKHDLLMEGFRNLRAQLQAASLATPPARGAARRFSFSQALFEHVGQHRRVYHAIVGRDSGTVVMRELRAILLDLTRQNLKVRSLRENLPDLHVGIVSAYVVGTIMSVITWLMEESPGLTSVEAEAIFYNLIFPRQ
jgi:AcrR family transcriptional regulator